MSQHRRSDRQSRAARPIVIDGEATVLARRPRTVAPTSAPGAGERFGAAKAGEAEPRPFGRRPEPRRPKNGPGDRDLIFQGAAARPFGPGRAAKSVAANGLSLFRHTSPARPGTRRMAGFAAALALLAIPASLVAAPLGGAVSLPPAAARPTLVIDDLVTSIRARGAGAVLSVEGSIRNVSAAPAAVPPLRIALAEHGGGLRTKALSTGAGPLGVGRAVRFHSTVAVAKGTRGDIAVEFIVPPPASGKTLIE